MSDNFEKDDFSWLRGSDKKDDGDDDNQDDFPEFDWMTDDDDADKSKKPDSKRLGVTGELSWLKDSDKQVDSGSTKGKDDLAFDWGTSKDTPGTGDSKRLGVTGQLDWLSDPAQADEEAETTEETPKGGTSPLDWRMADFEQQLEAAERAADSTGMLNDILDETDKEQTSKRLPMTDLFGDLTFADDDHGYDEDDEDADSEVPSWLRGNNYSASADDSPALDDFGDTEDDEDSTPDWLKGSTSAVPAVDEQDDERDVPSWLRGAMPNTAELNLNLNNEDEDDFAAATPSWLQGAGFDEPEEDEVADTPSWLQGAFDEDEEDEQPATQFAFDMDEDDAQADDTLSGLFDDFSFDEAPAAQSQQSVGAAQSDDFDLLGALTADTGDDNLDDLFGTNAAAGADDFDLLSMFEEEDLSTTSQVVRRQSEDDFFASIVSTKPQAPSDEDVAADDSLDWLNEVEDLEADADLLGEPDFDGLDDLRLDEPVAAKPPPTVRAVRPAPIPEFDAEPAVEEDIDAFLASLGAGGLDFDNDSALVPSAEADFDDLFEDSAFAKYDTSRVDQADSIEKSRAADLLPVSSLVRKQPDRPVESLSERLQALREEGMNLPSVAPAEVPRSLSELFPDVTDTLPLAPVHAEPTTETAARVPGEIALSPKQAEKVAVLTALTSASATAAVVSTVTNPEALTEREAEALLTEALEIAGRPEVKRRLRPQIQQRTQVRIGQLLVALVILLAVLMPFLGVVKLGTLPPERFTLGSPQQAAFDLVNNLATSDLVLIAAEYSATASGELDTITDALLRHILSRGGRPVIVSSNPIGLLRADNRIRDIAGSTLVRNTDFYVGRYLAGDTIGLRGFSQNIALLTRTDVRGEATGLEVESLNEFSLVIVIAENADSVRTWSEQVAATTITPFVFAVGYSAEPLAIPYADSVNGANSPALLIGYRDGYTYTQVLQALFAGGDIAPFDPSKPTETPTLAPTIPATETPVPSDTPVIEEPTTAATEEINGIGATEEISGTEEAAATQTPADVDATKVTNTVQPATPTTAVTNTPVPTDTPQPTNTLTPTATFTPSNTPTATFTSTDTPEPEIYGRISADQAVNVRQGAGRTFPVVGVVQPNARVRILGENEDASWLNIRLEDGTEGWVSADLVELEETGTPSASIPSLGIGVNSIHVNWRSSDFAQATLVVPNATDLMATVNAAVPNATDLMATASALAPLSPIQMATANALATSGVATEQFIIPQIDSTGTFAAAQSLVQTSIAVQTLGITAIITPEASAAVLPAVVNNPTTGNQASIAYQDERWYAMTLGIIVIVAMIFVGNMVTLIRRFSRRGR